MFFLCTLSIAKLPLTLLPTCACVPETCKPTTPTCGEISPRPRDENSGSGYGQERQKKGCKGQERDSTERDGYV
jgi:hypothetical protein